MTAPAPMLTPPAVARRLGIKSDTARDLIRSGELRGVDLARRGSKRPRFRVSEAALAEFLLGRTVQPPLPKPPRRRKRDPEVIQYF